MGKWILLLLLALGAPAAHAGDEDVKQEKAAVVPAEPEPTPLPEEPEAPGMSLGEEPEVVSPEFNVPEEAAPLPKRQAGKRKPYDPDANMDYSELLSLAEPVDESRGVLPPALGARGYRPNLIAGSVGDRTPGYGGFLEYSWNRLGAGLFYSYRNLKDADRYSYTQSILGMYGLYRWLPFDFSPYLLVGLEAGKATAEDFGALAGLGLEVRVYSGWTILLGYTYHSTVHKGFLGGAFGWSF